MALEYGLSEGSVEDSIILGKKWGMTRLEGRVRNILEQADYSKVK